MVLEHIVIGEFDSKQAETRYAHTIWHVDAYLEAVDSAFASIVEAMSRGEVKDRLIGQPAMAGFRRLA